ncbi:MAG: phage holin family protein [Verrucomicrobiales bacterium]|nr:phage holin family protein [Verrucomicrobiales bacterium]MCP5527939.1 phage holin family protein [Verrucomicrobiales bacterium]
MPVHSHNAPARPGWVPFLRRWVVTTLAVLVAANVIPGIDYQSPGALFVASLLLGVLNAFLKPLLLVLSLPLLLLSLGVFVLFVNAFLLYLVGQLVGGFEVAGFASAFFGGLVISLVSVAVNLLTGNSAGWRVQGRIQRRPDEDDDHRRPPGNGPLIDV